MNGLITDEVTTRFAEIMKIDRASIDLDVRLDEGYGVDSMNSMRLISELEVALGADIPEEKVGEIATLRDVIRLCEQYRPQEPQEGDRP